MGQVCLYLCTAGAVHQIHEVKGLPGAEDKRLDGLYARPSRERPGLGEGQLRP